MSYSTKYKTPLVKDFRPEGETMVVFPSAMEDIGLNLNERKNRVALTHYALLNIPTSQAGRVADGDPLLENVFDACRIQGLKNSLQDNQMTASQLLSVSLRNYVLNFETTLRNDPSYNANTLETVSERAFFKWLKETGAIRFVYNPKTKTWTEPSHKEYRRVVHCIGEINAFSNNRSEFGMYNETYISCPSTYGSNPMHFVSRFDGNYKAGKQYNASSRALEGHDNTQTQTMNLEALGDFQGLTLMTGNYYVSASDAKYDDSPFDNMPYWWQMTKPDYAKDSGWKVADKPVYIVDDEVDVKKMEDWGNYLDDTINYPGHSGEQKKFKRSRLDGISLVKDLTDLRRIHGDESLTYDSLAMSNAIDKNPGTTSDRSFEFNTILVYYTIYNSEGTEALATNLYGVVFVNGAKAAVGSNTTPLPVDQLTMTIPTYNKRMSSPSSIGNGYSFKINVKTLDTIDDTGSIIHDHTTSAHLALGEYRDVFYSLSRAIEIMEENNKALLSMNDKMRVVQDNYSSLALKMDKVEKTLDDLKRMKFSEAQKQVLDKIKSELGGDVSGLVADVARFNSALSKIESDHEQVKEFIKTTMPDIKTRLKTLEDKVK